MNRNSKTQKRIIKTPWQAAILTASALLLGGCRTPVPVVPNPPAASQIVRLGETVTYTCPQDCRYSIITTDKGLRYLQGLE